MALIVLSKEEISELEAFMREHKLEHWFIAKDQGAYVGASIGKNANWIKYFNGCNPSTDEYWWENCEMKFGGDDFGEMFDYKEIAKARLLGKSMKIKVSEEEIGIYYG